MIDRDRAKPKDRRKLRVGELIKRELVSILGRSVKDPRIGQFTVTEVEVHPDFRIADVYVCRFMDENREPNLEDEEALIEGLKSASHFIYEQLKRRLSMKAIPSVRFHYDKRFMDLAKIWALTANAVRGERS